MYILLDAHLRLEALKALRGTEALYLISTDDEGFTYNREINCLIPIREQKMISAALEKGMEATRIAQVLGVNLDQIHERANL